LEKKELEDVLFAVKYTHQFYNKQLEDIHRQVWSRTVLDSGYSSFQWLECLRQWPSIGKFAPRPAEILEQLNLKRENKPKSYGSSEPLTTDCPEPIAKAWRYWIPIFWGQSLPFNVEEDDLGEAEAYLLLVNEEAKRANTPEAIPDKYKLEQIWNAG
jgi:hypothetical protein